MKFIKKWSYGCAKYLSQQLNDNHEKRSIYYFGIQVIIGSIVKLAILLATAFILGILKETLVILLFFIIFRMTAGGYHMDTYGKCMVVSMCIFLLTGLFVHYTFMYCKYLNIYALTILNIVTFLIGLFCFYKWAPADTPNKPIKKKEKIRKLKRQSIIQLFITTAIVFILIYRNLYLYALAACMGTLVEIFNITPLGYSLYDKIISKTFFFIKKTVKNSQNH